jgi:hypothetical protein
MNAQVKQLEEMLLGAASHCQGGHSGLGAKIADYFGIPFPLCMANLRKAAINRGFEPAKLWPWWAGALAGKDN